jgi:hypothetical protein
MYDFKYALSIVDFDTDTGRHRSKDNCWTPQTSAVVDNKQDKMRPSV